MKVKIELFGAARDFSDQSLLELDLGQKTTIKDIRNKIIQYVDQKFHGNENYIKIINSSAFCSEKNNIVSDNYKICLLYTSPSPRDRGRSRMPSSA